MDATNPPAFPLHDKTCANPGMTLRDYFAAHAPPVADWFEHIKPPARYPAKPSADALPEGFREEAKSWLSDPCWDLDESAKEKGVPLEPVLAFMEAAREHYDGKEDWSEANRFGRMTQWAYVYADAMLAARA